MALLIGGATALLTRTAPAQTSTGSIRGYVTDSSGAPLEGARVIAVNIQTSAQREVATQARGFYALLGLVPAEYEVTARHIGMAPQKLRVRVLIAEVFPLDFKLGASAVQLEAVTVAAAAGVETRTSEVATSVTPLQMERLPSTSRNFFDLAALAPGLTVAPDFVNLGTTNAGVTDKTFSYGAQGAGQVNVFVDGASLKNDLTGGESGFHGGTFGQDASRGNPFPRSAIQEYRVITQNYKAEYQQSSGPVIVATTKSGGNVWSGDAFVSYQNKDLVALDSISAAGVAKGTFTKPDYTRTLVGVSGGGTLIKDRLFFFGSYEGNYQNRDALVNITGVPAAGTFPALDTVSFTRYNGNFTSPFRETLVFGKLSYTIGGHSSAELSFTDRHETDVRDFGQFAAFDNATNHKEDATTTILKYNYFTGALLNEVNAAYEHFEQNPALNTPGLPQRWYYFSTSNTCCITLGSNLSVQNFTQKRLALRDDITYTGFHGGGDHVMKAGVSTSFLTYDINKANRQIPQFFFSSNPSTGDAGCAPTCTGPEAYNYRAPFQVVWAYGDPRLNTNNAQVGAYVQDDWSPSSRLTFNLGIRWDFETHMYNYDYVTPDTVRRTIETYYSTLFTKIDTTEYFTNGTQRHKFYGAFQPRFGFSYALDRENKTSVFGAWGLYYDRTYFDISVDEMLKLRRPDYTVHFADPDSTPTANQLAWNNTYMTADTTVLKSLITGRNSANREVWLIANHVKVPKSSHFNVGIRHLFGDVAVSATYVGVRSWDGLVFNWANHSLDTATATRGNCCIGGDFGHGFSNILYTTNSAKTWYDALQVEITRPYRKTGDWSWGGGLSYTSGARSVSGQGVVGDVFSTNPNSAVYPKHPTNDEKSRLVANWTLDVPYAAGVQFSGLITLGTGPRYSVGGYFPNSGYVPGGWTPPQYPFILPGGWAYRDVDFRLRKDFPSISGTTVGVTVDVFNVFNFNNFNYPDNNNGNPAPNGLLSDPRRVQLGAEYHF
ncbi:MAG TPA: carboxypeptidase regulatory-like domain-containing protein [Gemmatimonadales bacterium]|nr:carboxypeptidase regulatory-like domain-containing protein [Gemmatimonadales bacterium]